MEARNLKWLRDEVAVQVNFDQDDPNDDFGGVTGAPWKRIDMGINRAYRREWRKAVNEVGGDRFWGIEPVTWPITQRTLVLPEWLNDSGIIAIDDETTTVPGYRVWVNPRWGSAQPKISWRDRRTLQWGTDGPDETKTLGFIYVAEPSRLFHEIDTPDLIPYSHRDVIVQSASVHLKFLHENQSPPEWRMELNDLRMDFWQAMKRRPKDPVGNRIRKGLAGSSY
jgi:hypothetical protein